MTRLFGAALQDGVVDAVETDLEAILSLIHGDESFRTFLYSPQVPRDEKVRISDKLFSDRITALTMSALRLLLEKRREPEFELVREEYARLRRLEGNVVYAVITSAAVLPQDQQVALIDKLTSKTGKKVEAVFKVDLALIGGVRVAYGSYVLDGSVRGSLERLADKLKYDLLKQN